MVDRRLPVETIDERGLDRDRFIRFIVSVDDEQGLDIVKESDPESKK